MKLNKKELIAFFVIIFIFILVEAKGLALITPGDENVYYYMAKSITEGKLPYKDFFYAHPPVHIFILAGIIKIFGINFIALKTTALLAYLTASFFLYKTSIGLFRNRLNDKHAYLMSILALVLFLFSFEVMFKATFSLGIEFSLMFLMISFYSVFNQKYFVGGIFAGIAGLTRLYALPMLFAVFVFVFVKKIQEHKVRDFLYMAAGFLLTFGIIIVFLALLFGNNFIEPVFKYHLLKPKLPNQKMTVYKNVLKEDWMIFFAFLLSMFIKNKKQFQIFYFAIFTSFLFLLYLNVIPEFYFIIAFPFMAVIGSYSIVELARTLDISKSIRYILIISLCSVFFWNTAADVMFLEQYGFLKFEPLNQIASKISATNPNEELFGDDATVSLAALLANRKIALNYIDANEMRFTSGLTNFFLFKSELDSQKISYMIFRKSKGLYIISQFREYANARCSLENQYSDLIEGDILMYKCNPSAS